MSYLDKVTVGSTTYDIQDSKAQADVNDLKSALEEDETLLFDETSETITTESSPEMASGYYDVNGEAHTGNGYEHTTDIISVMPGDVIYCSATVQPGETSPSNPCLIRILTAYNGSTAIAASGDSTGTLKTYTVPDDINGIRITINLSDYVAGSLIVHHTTTQTEKAIKPELITTPDTELDASSDNAIANSTVTDAIADIADYQYGNNMLDASQNETGFIQSDGTVSTSGSSANYVTSDYIRIENTKSYCISTYMTDGRYYSATRKACVLYTTGKEAVSGSYQNIASGDIVITPSADGYVRVSFANSVVGMVEVGTTHTAYEAYSKSYELNPSFSLTQTMISEIPNTLSGKKWVHCGDSASDYTNKNFESGTFSGRYKTFPRLIAERNHMTLLQDFMLSGRTLAYPADGTFQNSICAPTQTFYYQNIPADTDYITIMLGGNDCQHVGSGTTPDGEDATGVITLGTIMDADPTGTAEEQAVGTSTYYGAWNTVCHWLRVNRPYAHVGIVIENMMAGHPDYTAAQIAIAKKWGYPYINLNGDQHTPTMIRTTSTDVPSWIKDLIMTAQSVDAPSNTHPNWQTHELESTIIENWLRSL